MQHSSFSTDLWPLADRYEAWRCRGWPSLAPILDSSPPEGPFDARIDTLVLGAISLGYCRITGLDYRRDTDLIRRDGIDHYGFTLTLGGNASGDAAGAEFAAGPGTLLVGDFARPNRMHSSDADCITLAVPRRLAEAAIPDLSRHHGLVTAPRQTAMLTDFLLSLRRNAALLQAADVAGLERILLDLVAMAIGPRAEPEPGDESREWRARRFIATQLRTRDLNGDLIAATLKISRATLYRLFAPHGGVASYIRGERLALACRMLEDRARPLPVAAIGEACGFRDAGHFARAFRARYGESPSDRRHRALLDPDPGRRTAT